MSEASVVGLVRGAAAWLIAGFALWAPGCDGGCGANRGLSVGGDTPYVRCLAAAPPASGTRQVGPLTLTIKDRVLEVRGISRGAKLAAFSGPGFGRPPSAADLGAVRAAQPDLVILLGDLGDTQAIANSTALSLAGLGRPVFILAGGRDSRERITNALDAAGRNGMNLTDISGLQAIRIGSDTFLPVAGAFDGRDGLADDSCGYAENDLRDLVTSARSHKGRKWLVAWQAPTNHRRAGRACLACTDQGIDLGSGALARFEEAAGASGGIYAWPHVQALRPIRTPAPLQSASVDTREIAGLVVPRLIGPALERSDGSYVPAGFVLLKLANNRLEILNAPARDN